MKRPLACFCMIFIFAVWLGLRIAGPPDDPYDEYEGQTVSLYGTVEKKEIRSDSEAVYLKDVSFADSSGFSGEKDQEKQFDKGMICYMPVGESPPMGAFVSVTGKISGFRKATNPGEFDMKNYYLCNGYGASLRNCVWAQTDGRYDRRRELLWDIRCSLGESISAVLGEEDAGVIRAMLLGDKSELAKDIKTLYAMNGIAHILAISGLHISIIGIALYKFMRKLSIPVMPSAAAGGILMINFAQMTGSGTSTIRAVTMFVIMVLADTLRRSYDLPTALAISAFMTITVNPYELIQSGFWMSYLAVTGVAVFGKAVKEGIEIDNMYAAKFADILVGGICVTAFTMPVTALSYYEIPVYSVLLNIMVIPLMTIVLSFGIISMIVGMISVPAGIVLAYPCHLIIGFYTFLCRMTDRLPMSHYICGAPNVVQIILCYGIFICIILLGKKIKAAVRFVLIATALVILLIKIPKGFRLTVLDVGQGDCICAASDEMVCMIDGGSTSEKDIYTYRIEPFLKYEGISRIDLWFVTHPDTDHISGLTEMLMDGRPDSAFGSTERGTVGGVDNEKTVRSEGGKINGIEIGTIVLPDAKGASKDCAEIIALAEMNDIPVVFFASGDEAYSGTDEDDMHILCIHPSSGYETDDANTYSQVLEIRCGDFEGIFTGDATAESEMAMLEAIEKTDLSNKIKNPPDGYDVLKAGHHGSSTSSTREWLEYVRPKKTIISCGKNNSYGHPHAEVIGRLDDMGSEIFRTDEMGAVEIKTDRQ